jgi:hypothetical protein
MHNPEQNLPLLAGCVKNAPATRPQNFNPPEPMALRKRAKWKRLAMWPRYFWCCYRIQEVLSIRERAYVAILMANAITKH